MASRPLLNARQVDVLGWIGAGCPDRQWPDFTYKNTARALQDRRLVIVRKTSGGWAAELTTAGRYYLEHGGYAPRQVERLSAGRRRASKTNMTPTVDSYEGKAPAPAVRSQPKRTAPKKLGVTDQLIADLVAAGGEMTVETHGSINYEARVAAAIRFGKVPARKLLVIEHGQDWKTRSIKLVDPPAWMTERLAPLPISNRVSRPHSVAQSLRADNRPQAMRPAVRGHAVRVLHALITAAESRGIKAAAIKSNDQYGRPRDIEGDIEFTVQGHRFGLSVSEQLDKVPHEPTATELRRAARDAWFRIPKDDQVKTDRLRLTITNGRTYRQSAWNEGTHAELGMQLAEILQELELRAGFAEEQRLEQERRDADQQRRWEAAMDRAKSQLVETHREKILIRQLELWQRANSLDVYLGQMRSVIEAMPDETDRSTAHPWLEWAHAYRNSIDPLAGEIRMPTPPEPTAENLKPYLGRWSFYGPRSGW